MSVSFDYYKVFYYVAKYGNITTASRALFLSQPTVSRCMQNLEAQLGLSLFVRSKKGVRLTPEGALLYGHVEKACDHLFKAEAELHQYLGLQDGLVRIGASETTLHHYLLPFLEQFRSLHPSIRLKISNTNTPEALQLLSQGQIDFAVLVFTGAGQDDFHVTPLSPSQDIFIGGSQYAHLRNRTLSVQELTRYPLITLMPGTATRQFLEQYFLEHQARLTPDIELATTDLVTPMVAHNLGLAAVSEAFAAESLESGEVFALKLEDPLPPRFVCMVTNPEHPASLAASAFMEMLSEASDM